MKNITQQRLRELFVYDAETGDLIWKRNPGKRRQKGCIAGGTGGHKYKRIGIDDNHYLAHRVTFLFHHGYLPQFVDHINGVKTDNRIENLRAATKSENSMNRPPCITPFSSKWKGVSWSKHEKAWRSQIKTNGIVIRLGKFANEEDAALAYDVAAFRDHGQFAAPNILQYEVI